MESINQNVLNDFISQIKLKYKNKIQDLVLTQCTDHIQLNLILIKKSQRCKGYGSSVMFTLTSYADQQNVQIRLYLKDLTEMKRLLSFYTKHEFVLIKNKDKDK